MVSVIIPNYNHAKYLKQRIDSVLNQTYQDFEVIILDDCSTDNSREVIESYRGHEKICNIVYNEQNSGSTFKQWDKGFSLAKGEYIWIAESDDVAELDFLEISVPLMDSDAQISFVSTNSNFIDSEGEVFQRGITNPVGLKLESCFQDSFDGFRIFDGGEFVKKYLFFYNFISNASAVVFRKDNALSVPNNYKTFKLNGDWLFWSEMCLDKKVAVVNSLLNNFRFHNNNARTNTKYLVALNEIVLLQKSIFDKFTVPRHYLKQGLIANFNQYMIWVDYNVDEIYKAFTKEQLDLIPLYKYKLYYYQYIYHPIRILFFIIKAIFNKIYLNAIKWFQ